LSFGKVILCALSSWWFVVLLVLGLLVFGLLVLGYLFDVGKDL